MPTIHQGAHVDGSYEYLAVLVLVSSNSYTTCFFSSRFLGEIQSFSLGLNHCQEHASETRGAAVHLFGTVACVSCLIYRYLIYRYLSQIDGEQSLNSYRHQ